MSQEPPREVAGFQVGEVLEARPGVHLCRAVGAGGEAALLVLYRDPPPSLRQDLERLASLDHRAWPLVLDRGEADGWVWLALEDEGSVDLASRGAVGPRAAAEGALQVAEGLETARAAGMEHGFLHVRVLPESGRLRLLGLAPEPGDGLARLGEALFLMLAGEPAPPERIGPALRRAAPGVPPWLEWTATRLLAPGEPEGFRSLREVIAHLDEGLEEPRPRREERWSYGPSLLDVPLEDEPPPPPRDRRLRSRVAMALGALLLALLVLGGPWDPLRSRPEPTPNLALQEEVVEADGSSGRGVLRFQGEGLDPADTLVKVKVVDGSTVIVEEGLPGGKGRLEVPMGRLLSLEMGSDLHTPRRRKVLLTEAEPEMDIRVVLLPNTMVTVATRPGALVRLDGAPVGLADENGLLRVPAPFLEVGRFCEASAALAGYEEQKASFTVKPGHAVVHLDLPEEGQTDPPGSPPPPGGPEGVAAAGPGGTGPAKPGGTGPAPVLPGHGGGAAVAPLDPPAPPPPQGPPSAAPPPPAAEAPPPAAKPEEPPPAAAKAPAGDLPVILPDN